MSPVIAGLDDKTSMPYICGMDTIGAIETADDFMVAGTAPDSLYGMCESMFRPDMVRIPLSLPVGCAALEAQHWIAILGPSGYSRFLRIVCPGESGGGISLIISVLSQSSCRCGKRVRNDAEGTEPI